MQETATRTELTDAQFTLRQGLPRPEWRKPLPPRGYRPAPGRAPLDLLLRSPESTVEDEHFCDPDSPRTASAGG